MIKFYIHHSYTQTLDYKITHNLSEAVREENSVKGKYEGHDFHFIFNPELNDAEDGYHLIDWYASKREGRLEEFWDYSVSEHENDSISFIKYCQHVLQNRKGWIITFFRTEKLLITQESYDYPDLNIIENELDLLKSHHIITDNYFINQNIAYKYPHFHFAFTNTIFQWNESWAIRWYVEVGEIHKRLNFDWNLVYSVRNHKWNRVQNLIELNKLGMKGLLLQRSDSLQNDWYWRYDARLDGIKKNSIHEGSDFDRLDYIKGHDGYLDTFFRVLLMGKMQILDESWAWNDVTYTSQYLSEKTIGLILAGIPFISTHSYPLDIIKVVLEVEDHPFINQTRKYQGNPKEFSSFVSFFMGDFNFNCSKCEEWINSVKTKMLKLLREKNSLLDLSLLDFKEMQKKRQII